MLRWWSAQAALPVHLDGIGREQKCQDDIPRDRDGTIGRGLHPMRKGWEGEPITLA
ncbi:MAG: hypothetical protein M0P17_00695 [Methanoculleus sp.]|nr:hypothetical protein [Methanoculleus sp.]